MTAVTHAELDAKLATIEAKSDAKIDSIRNLIDNFLVRAEERDKVIDLRFTHIDERFSHIDQRFSQIDARFGQIDARFEQIDARFAEVNSQANEHSQVLNRRVDELSHEMKGVKQSLSAQRYWMVGTGVATLIGVAALNAASQANIVAAFESGTRVSAAIIRNSHAIDQLRETNVDRSNAGSGSDSGG